MDDSRILRWAIIGTGFISETMVEAIASCAGSRIELVAGRSAQRAAAFADRHSIPRSCEGYETAVADPEVDVVYVGTPSHAHHEVVAAAAAAGKAILSEKSLTTTMADAHRLVDAVEGRVFFVEGLMYLAHPVIDRFRELLTDPRTGTVTAIHAGYAADIGAVVNPLGGGTIYNLGCYPASLLHLTVQSAFGDDAFGDRRLAAHGTRTPDGTIGSTTASIRFGNDVLATLSSSDDYGMAFDVTVLTTTGELRFLTNPWLPVAGDNQLRWTPYDGAPETFAVTSDGDGFIHQVRLVERAIAAGRTEVERPSPRLGDSLEIMSLLTEWEAACAG
ncbi:MAG: Gfo/Idh/MocA family oxidoreductase [Actinomycetota bacterium]